jgi:serine/threonine protein kinase
MDEGKNRKRKLPSRDSKTRSKPAITSGFCANVTNRFEKVGRVGEGTYGVVYKARDKEANGNLVALKRCIPHHESSDGFPLTTLREVHALRLCAQHPHVVDLLTVAVSNSSGVFLVMPLIGSLDLAQILDEPKFRPRPFNEAQIKTLLRQLFGALAFCHDHSLIHRDIKRKIMLPDELQLQVTALD